MRKLSNENKMRKRKKKANDSLNVSHSCSFYSVKEISIDSNFFNLLLSIKSFLMNYKFFILTFDSVIDQIILVNKIKVNNRYI